MKNTEDCLAIIRIGNCEIGVPARNFHEVVPHQTSLSPFPASTEFVPGIANLHGRPAMAVNLFRVLQPELAATPNFPLLVYLRCARGLCALFADAVVRIVRPDADHLSHLHTDCVPALFDRLYTEKERAISILDVERLALLPGVHFVETAASSVSDSRENCLTDLHTIFRINDLKFALPVSAVVCAQTVPALAGSDLRGRRLRGFFEFETHQTGLINLLCLLNLRGADILAPEHQMLLIRSAGKTLAFGIHAICGLERIAPADIHPLSDASIDCVQLYQGTARSNQHGEVFVLNVDALLNEPSVQSLVALNEKTDDASAMIHDQLDNYIIYDVNGHLLASPIGQLSAVAPLPESIIDLRVNAGPFVGYFNWQGKVLPLLDLGHAFGTPLVSPYPHSCRILISQTGASLRGLLVSGVRFLHRGTPKPMPRSVLRRPSISNPVDITHMLPLRGNQRLTNCAILNLPTLKLGLPPDGGNSLPPQEMTPALNCVPALV